MQVNDGCWVGGGGGGELGEGGVYRPSIHGNRHWWACPVQEAVCCNCTAICADIKNTQIIVIRSVCEHLLYPQRWDICLCSDTQHPCRCMLNAAQFWKFQPIADRMLACQMLVFTVCRDSVLHIQTFTDHSHLYRANVHTSESNPEVTWLFSRPRHPPDLTRKSTWEALLRKKQAEDGVGRSWGGREQYERLTAISAPIPLPFLPIKAHH